MSSNLKEFAKDSLKDFAKALVDRIKNSGVVRTEIVSGGYCETCFYEYEEIVFDDSQLDREIDELCAEFEARNA